MADGLLFERTRNNMNKIGIAVCVCLCASLPLSSVRASFRPSLRAYVCFSRFKPLRVLSDVGRISAEATKYGTKYGLVLMPSIV